MSRYFDEFRLLPRPTVPQVALGLAPAVGVLALARATPRSPSALVSLTLLSTALLRANERWEGVILVIFKPDRGLTTTDLIGMTGLAIAYRKWRGLRLHVGRNAGPVAA